MTTSIMLTSKHISLCTAKISALPEFGLNLTQPPIQTVAPNTVDRNVAFINLSSGQRLDKKSKALPHFITMPLSLNLDAIPYTVSQPMSVVRLSPSKLLRF